MTRPFPRLTGSFAAVVIAFSSLIAMPTSPLLAEDTKKTEKHDPHKVYNASATPMADVKALLASAAAADKKAVVVIGANWCHDSLAMVKKLKDDSIQPVLDQSYEVGYVSVGYFDQAMDLSAAYGMPMILGTPTVLILDPKTGAIQNSDTRHKWRNAYSISQEDVTAYFTEHAGKTVGKSATEDLSSKQKELLAQVAAFEASLAPTLMHGYAHIGPMMADYKENGVIGKTFMADWGQLARYRGRAAKDIKAMREQVLAGDLADDFTFNFPVYKPMSWEYD